MGGSGGGRELVDEISRESGEVQLDDVEEVTRRRRALEVWRERRRD